MDVILGALGALLFVAVFGGGVLTGWKAHERFCRPTAKAPEEEELKRLRAEQEAFRQLTHYNADIAYGVQTSADPFEGSDAP